MSLAKQKKKTIDYPIVRALIEKILFAVLAFNRAYFVAQNILSHRSSAPASICFSFFVSDDDCLVVMTTIEAATSNKN